MKLCPAKQWQRVHRQLAPKFDGLILVNLEDAQSILADSPELNAERVKVIPNGVDTDYFHPSEDSGKRNNGKFRIIFTGCMNALQSELAVNSFLPIS